MKSFGHRPLHSRLLKCEVGPVDTHIAVHAALPMLLCCHLEACVECAFKGRQDAGGTKAAWAVCQLPLCPYSLLRSVDMTTQNWGSWFFIFPCRADVHYEFKNSTLLWSVNILQLVRQKASSKFLWCRLLKTPHASEKVDCSASSLPRGVNESLVLF